MATSVTDPVEHVMARLIDSHRLEDLHATVAHSLSTRGWTERVRHLALELFRTGHHNRFEDVVDSIVTMATSNQPSSVLGKRKRENNEPILDGKEIKPMANGVGPEKDKQKQPSSLPAGGQGTTNGESHQGKRIKSETITGSGGDDRAIIDGELEQLATEYDVRIPEEVVDSGVKILHSTLHELFGSEEHDDDATGEDDAEGISDYESLEAVNGRPPNGQLKEHRRPPSPDKKR
ncbi:hypothetical protein FQN57_001294 [Myotisia sp. PD_48]|nr:hypothetical protein FQN57_001294 [Myotisia sp. PD_48]